MLPVQDLFCNIKLTSSRAARRFERLFETEQFYPTHLLSSTSEQAFQVFTMRRALLR